MRIKYQRTENSDKQVSYVENMMKARKNGRDILIFVIHESDGLPICNNF